MNLAETFDKFAETFDKYEDDFLRFDQIKNPLSSRHDLHAFILLDRLSPGMNDMICAAAHDEIFLGIDPEELSKVITEEQVRELVMCGVTYDIDHDCLKMFV